MIQCLSVIPFLKPQNGSFYPNRGRGVGVRVSPKSRPSVTPLGTTQNEGSLIDQSLDTASVPGVNIVIFHKKYFLNN